MKAQLMLWTVLLMGTTAFGQPDFPEGERPVSKFMRGDFVQVIFQRKFQGPSEVVEPKGEFAKIDVAQTNAMLIELLAVDPKTRDQAIEKLKADPELYAPPALFLAAFKMYELGQKEDAVYYLLLGRIRLMSDVRKSLDSTTNQAILVLNHQYGMPLEELVFSNYRNLGKTIRNVVDWDRKHPRKYDPKWIALHGLKAFDETLIAFEPMEAWEEIDRQIRIEFKDAIDSFVESVRQADQDGDGVISKKERERIEGTPLVIAPEIKMKSMAGEQLFYDMSEGDAGVNTIDSINFPATKNREVVDIEVIIPSGGVRNGVERWTVRHDGKFECYYTLTLIQAESGGTFIVTTGICEPTGNK